MLEYVDHPLPDRAAGDVLVRIRSTSVNPVEYMIRQGKLPFSKKRKILGGDLSGVVEAADNSSQFKAGDRVFALSPDCSQTSKWGVPNAGTYAEQACIKPSLLATIPDEVSFDEAAAMPLVSLTALQALKPANIKAEQRVLIHGASGGVGSVAVQLAQAWGAHVTATCSTKNIQLVKSLGADEVVDYTQESVDQLFKNDPFDVVMDQIGGTTTTQSLAVLKKSGHMCIVLNNNMNKIQLASGLAKSSLGFGPKWHTTFAKPSGEDMQQIAKLMAAGQLRAVIDKTFPLEQTAAAHQYAETSHPSGKVVIRVSS